MSQLFQKRVLADFAKKQDDALIQERWEAFQEFKSNVQDNINDKKSFLYKEQEYQAGFFQDVFEKCLGYTLNITNQEFNLRREVSNAQDSKKADGAILIDNNVIGVIELKSQDTKNLDMPPSKGKLSPVDQAFRYLNSHDSQYCKYTIVSNFDELRFYIRDKLQYELFNLFTLDYEEFKKLHTILSYESISNDLPLKIKQKSATFEKDITDELYKDYTKFRNDLFADIKKHNSGIDEVKLLSLTQKLIDRIIFILFAEDTGILPINSIYTIIDKFNEQKNSWSETEPLYDFYKLYFKFIDKGYKSPDLEVHAYNGGLFAKDVLLDDLIIDDEVLKENAKKLSAYRFGSDISVNILGHIFEKSITALEEIAAQIQNTDYDKKKSQQKIDGAFYTPQYITKYIINNTLGKLCIDKKIELDLNEIEEPKNSKSLNNKEKINLKAIYEYKEWLLNLKILDPACGSGAFLNQALEFLLAEHKLIDDYRKLYENEGLGLYDTKANILKNNLYGVDINEGAVDIAKLSLWLSTAKPGEPLTALAEKIKVGNSLINDKSIVDNAFVWKDEFPEVFESGGFDVIIGNPPYIRVQGLKKNFEKESFYYESEYKSAVGKYDIYALFLERSFTLLNEKGKLGYILPHKFLIADFGKGIRGFLSENRAVESLLHFGSEMVFEASTYTCIVTLSHNNEDLYFKSLKPSEIFNTFEFDSIDYKLLDSTKWDLSNQDILKVRNKLEIQPLRLKDIFSKISVGVQSLGDEIYLLRGKFKDDNFIAYSKELNCEVKLEKGIMKPLLKGDDVKRYEPLETDLYIIYPHFINDKNKTKPLEEDFFRDNFPLAYEYLEQFKELLIERKIRYKTNPKYWYALHRSKEISMFQSEKIITPEISYGANMTYDINSFYHGTTHYTFIKKDEVKEDYKFYLTILNSSLMWFFIKNTSTELRGGYFRFKTKYLEPFPLPELEKIEDQEPFVQKADLMLVLNKDLHETKQNFIDMLELEKIPKILQNFEDLKLVEFIKEYEKVKKVKFKNKLEESNFKEDWRDLFEQKQKEALELKSKIDTTDKEIDEMVYKLYNLSSEEIEIVENQT